MLTKTETWNETRKKYEDTYIAEEVDKLLDEKDKLIEHLTKRRKVLAEVVTTLGEECSKQDKKIKELEDQLNGFIRIAKSVLGEK